MNFLPFTNRCVRRLLLVAAFGVAMNQSLMAAGVFEAKDGVSNFEGSQRSYQIATPKNLATESYRAEITVKVAGGEGLGTAFFGIGDGQPNREFYGEPTTTPSLTVAVRPTNFAQGALSAMVNSQPAGQTKGPGDGTHRLRLTWNAQERKAIVEVHANWSTGATFAPSIRLAVTAETLQLTDKESFFCGGASGVTFSDFSAHPYTPPETFSNDATAGTWLPTGPAARAADDKTLAGVDQLLSSLHGQARLLVTWYDGSKLSAARALANGKVSTQSSEWIGTVTTKELKDKTPADGLEMDVKFQLAKGATSSSGVAVAFDFNNWDADNFVFAPAQLYDGNKFKIVEAKYPPYIYNPEDRPLDMPITTANILHLNKDRSPGLVEMKTFNLSTPMVGFYDRKAKRGFLFLAEPKTALGFSGLMVQEDPAAKKLSLVVSAPGVRTERYIMMGRAPSGDRGMDFTAGDEINLKLKVYNFEADGIPAFLQRAFELRKALTGPNTYKDVIPFSAAADLITDQHDKEKWYEPDGPTGRYGYISSNKNFFAHQIGWSGTPIFGIPQSILATPERLRRVARALDSLPEAQGKSGLYYAFFNYGEKGGDTFEQRKGKPYYFRESPHREVAGVRRSGDGLYAGVLELEILKAGGHQDLIKPEWEETLKKCADGLVTLYERYGQFGQFVNVETGDMVINGSTAGGCCVAGLAVASEYFKNPKYREIAEKSGQMYYDRDLSKGYSGGGPLEVMQSPDMESTWALADAYTALYDVTGNKKWLGYAKESLNLLATWMVAYDYPFPPDSDLGSTDTKAAGSMFASSQNNHSSPGIYIGSGDFFLRYYRATGDPRYAEMYKDVTHNVTQYLNTPHNLIQRTIPDKAYVTERVQMSDWEGTEFGRLTHEDSAPTFEVLTQMTALMNPGIYLNTTTGAMVVLDHVKTEKVKTDADGTTLRLTNTTPYDAKVSVFAETAGQAKKSLGLADFLKWPKVEVKVGETKEILVKPNGEVSVVR